MLHSSYKCIVNTYFFCFRQPSPCMTLVVSRQPQVYLRNFLHKLRNQPANALFSRVSLTLTCELHYRPQLSPGTHVACWPLLLHLHCSLPRSATLSLAEVSTHQATATDCYFLTQVPASPRVETPKSKSSANRPCICPCILECICDTICRGSSNISVQPCRPPK